MVHCLLDQSLEQNFVFSNFHMPEIYELYSVIHRFKVEFKGDEALLGTTCLILRSNNNRPMLSV